MLNSFAENHFGFKKITIILTPTTKPVKERTLITAPE